MQTTDISAPQPVSVPDAKVWLEMCSWTVRAGFPSPAADHTRKRLDLNELLIRNKEATFIFRVKGDSMNGIGIYEGDELLVDRSIEAKHGNIVLAGLVFGQAAIWLFCLAFLKTGNSQPPPYPHPAMQQISMVLASITVRHRLLKFLGNRF